MSRLIKQLSSEIFRTLSMSYTIIPLDTSLTNKPQLQKCLIFFTITMVVSVLKLHRNFLRGLCTSVYSVLVVKKAAYGRERKTEKLY